MNKLRISEKNEGSHRFLILSIVLAAIAYLPAVNNGFIADDYVILARAEVLKTDPLYLLTVPPDNFRLTTHLAFAVLKHFVGLFLDGRRE